MNYYVVTHHGCELTRLIRRKTNNCCTSNCILNRISRFTARSLFNEIDSFARLYIPLHGLSTLLKRKERNVWINKLSDNRSVTISIQASHVVNKKKRKIGWTQRKRNKLNNIDRSCLELSYLWYFFIKFLCRWTKGKGKEVF